MPNIPPETVEKHKPALSPIGDEKVSSEVQNFYDEAYKDRLPWEGSWLEWLAFYQGEPYVKYSPEQNKVVPDNRVAPWRRRIKENRIRTTVDQMVAMLTAEPVMLAARPASRFRYFVTFSVRGVKVGCGVRLPKMFATSSLQYRSACTGLPTVPRHWL